MPQREPLALPNDAKRLLLHSCCAPWNESRLYYTAQS